MRYLVFLFGIILSWCVSAGTVDAEKFRVIGHPSGAVIYVFSSPSCPHCAAFHRDVLPTLKDEMAGLAQIKLVEVPSDPRALKVAQLGRCMTDEQFYPYMEQVYQNQRIWLSDREPENLFRSYATAAGAGPDVQKRCLPNKQLTNLILQQAANLTQTYRVNVLPTVVVVQGTQTHSFVGADPEMIPQIVKLLRP